MNRLTVLCCLLLASMWLGTAAAEDADAAKPNIVLIMGDDVGCEALGCYGGTSFRTPHLDELARTGMRFRHCFSMPVCHPTRVCLLTGRYPFRLGHPRWGSFPPAEEKRTFAHVLKDAGYATAIAGKWQLTLLGKDPQHPQRLGFEQSSLFGWHEGPRYFQPLIWQNGRVRDDVRDRYGPDVYTEFLIDFIEHNRQRPFLAFYSMALCHDVTDDLPEPVPLGPQGRYESYHEMIEQMDERAGRIVAALDRLKLRDRTLVLFTGDNGTPKSYIATAVNGKLVREPIVLEANGRSVRGGKGELTDAGTNVPLIASWPGTVKAGTVVDDLIDFSDFLPTFAELGGGSLPEGVGIDGRSFASRLRGESKPGRTWAFSEQGGKHWARTQRWKLYGDGRLFDLQADPQEKTPIPSGQRTGEAAEARRALDAALKSILGE